MSKNQSQLAPRTAPKQKLTLDYLLSNKMEVYIRHNALKANLLLLLEMKDRHGRTQPVRIMPTEMPICLTERFSHDTIQGSDELRDLLAKRVIELVDPVAARQYIAENQGEVQAIGISAYSDAAAPNSAREGLSQLKEETEYGTIMASTDLGNDLSSDNAVTPKVQGIIASFETKEASAKATLDALKLNKRILTETDMNYILSKCKKDTQIRQFVEALRSELQ